MKYYLTEPAAYFLFSLHWIAIIYTFIASYFYLHTLFFYPIVTLSWYINDNKCFVSQIEYKLCNRTFLGNGNKVRVPYRMRYIFYINFFTASMFQIVNKNIQ